MPIYEFKCQSCGHQFEKLIFPGDDPAPPCPNCQASQSEKLMSAGAVRAHGIPSGSGGFKLPACAPRAG